MIFLDTNLFVIELRYPDDRLHGENRKCLERVRESGRGVTGIVNVLEACGILSFNLSPRQLREFFSHFDRRFGILVVPSCTPRARLPDPQAQDMLLRMEGRMALKDAGIAWMVEQYVSGAETFLSWNARHFLGRLPCSALTPRQWLARELD